MQDPLLKDIFAQQELTLEQNFKLTRMTQLINECRDINELKTMLITSLKDLIVKDNIINCLFKKLI